MDKNLEPKINPPGCLWGVIHVFRSHQWHSVKRMMPNKKSSARTRQTAGVKYSRLRSNAADTSEAGGSIDADADGIIIRDMSESNLTNNCKVDMQSLTAEEMSREQNDKYPRPTFRSHFLRTESIHHLEPSSDILPDEVREDRKYPTAILHKADANTRESTWDPFLLTPPGAPVSCCDGCELCSNTKSVKSLSQNQLDQLGRKLIENAFLRNKLEIAKDSFSRKKFIDAVKPPKDDPPNQSNEVLDTLQMLNVNNRVFQKTELDSSYALLRHFQALQSSNAKRALTKSVSFPANESSSRKIIEPKTLMYMQKEVEVIEDNTTRLSNDQESPDMGQTSTSSSLGSPVELKKRRFKDIKKRIKNAIKESRKEGHRISMDAIFHKRPYASESSKDVKSEITDKMQESVMKRGWKDSLRNIGSNGMRRTQSLNESLNRYSHLFEVSFGRETKQQLSDSLKLANDSGASSIGSAQKSLGRIRSLPDLESYSSLQCDKSGDTLPSETPTPTPTRDLVESKTSIESLGFTEHDTSHIVCTENHAELGAFITNGKQEDLVAVDEISEVKNDQVGLRMDATGNRIARKDEIVNDLDNLIIAEGCSVFHSEQDTRPEYNELTQPSPISDLDSCMQENISSPAKLSASEDPETPRSTRVGEMDSLMHVHDHSVMDSFSEALSTPELEEVRLPIRHLNTNFRHVQVDEKDEADFNFVKDVLKLSGFSGNEYLGTWYSPEQPVDPSFFEEVETSSPLKSDYSVDELSSSYDHQLLFDIINEVLLEIYDRSFTYWPLPLSCKCNCNIRPMPAGHHILREVWAIISWYLNSQPEFKPLDYLVERDLSKSDVWMNLQFDSECVGLELEEMILNDLLEEIIQA